MLNIIKNTFNRSAQKLKITDKPLAQIHELKPKIKKMSEEDIKKRVSEMKAELKTLVDNLPDDALKSLAKVNRREKFPTYEKEIQDKLLEFLPEVYAMLNEAYRRKTGHEYHDVQLRAGILLAQGQMLVEQYTGEGKTRTFQLPLALYSLAGRGSHLVTVNNYLTKVGAEYAGHFMSMLGLTVGVIAPEGSYKFVPDNQLEQTKGKNAAKERVNQVIEIDRMTGVNIIETTKREAYACDITYSTNNELGFDYLRDNMAWDLNRTVQSELYFCIIDEADSILIDEARTPLIISSTPSDADTEKYIKFANAVKGLKEEVDFIIDHKAKSANLTEDGMEKVEKFLGVENLWSDYSMAYHIENALKAKTLYIKDDQYIVRNGNVYIVDEFTGRILEGRRYSEGLHQAIEAKEGVDIQQESKTFATITFQNFFRLYKVLCGGSGTVMTESEEFYKIYGLDSVIIPTNRPNIRIDHPDRIYKNQEAKFRAVIEEVKEMNQIGRPVLIGTTSVEKSELVSKLLDAEGIPHEVLNAKYHEQESRIVANAGKKGAVTVATNMAGRGTDIVIGGGVRGDNEYNEIAKLGGLHVIGTERHESRRIDNQLRGRTARQGEPGSTRFYASLDDQIMRVLGGEFLARLLTMVKVPDNMPIEMSVISKQIETAQKRVEGMNFDYRKSVVEYDDVMNQHREVFYTRRKNIMQSAENALGRFKIGSQVIDLNLKENEDRVKDLEPKQNKAAEQFEHLIENLILDQIENYIYSNDFESLKNKDEKEKFIRGLNNLIPVETLTSALNINTTFEKYLENEIENNNTNLLNDLMKATEKVYDNKKEMLNQDFLSINKAISLETLDNKWVEHLEIMKDVRDSISLQGYAQRDPLVEYKNRAYGMFQSFISTVNSEITSKFFRVTKVTKTQTPIQELSTNEDDVEDILTGTREMLPIQGQHLKADSIVDDIERQAEKTRMNLRTNSTEKRGTIKTFVKKFGRNDKVNVKYSDGKEIKQVKYKKVEADVKAGKAVIV